MCLFQELDEHVVDSIIKILDGVLLCVGDFILLRWHSMIHVDQADGAAETLRDLIVISYDLRELLF